MMFFFLRELYARIRMHTWLYNERYGDRAELVARLMLDQEWTDFTTGYCRAGITLENGAKITIWDSNRYYGWMTDGKYEHNQRTIWWEHERPSIYTMYRLRNKMNREIRKILVQPEGKQNDEA